MINPATLLQENKTNEFTQFILDNPGTKVLLRNKIMVEPIMFLGEDDWEDDFEKPRGFHGNNWSFCWDLDGTSVTRSDLDMVEIVK